MAATAVGVAGVAVVVAVVVAGAGVAATPGLTFTVESSRKAVVRPAGSVPYQPGEGSVARVRCSL